MTGYSLGPRASEIRGLRWSDVNIEGREVRVHQRADRFNQIGKPKSEAGERTVPIPLLAWNAHSRGQAEGCRWKHLTEEIRPEQLIFPNSLGKVESLSKIMQRGCQPSQIRAGVSVQTGETDKDGNPISNAKYTGFHSLQHFYASWCINRREDGGPSLPPKMVQEGLGHSSITLTMDTYGHLFPRNDDAEQLAASELALLR